MSLVVAKKEGNNIYIVSNTMLTNPDNLNRVELPAPEAYSAIKIAIINPFIAIAFAADAPDAKKAIAICRKLDNKINEMLNVLLEANKTSNEATEFIMCINLPPYVIYEIKNSKIQSTAAAWIGLPMDTMSFKNIFYLLKKRIYKKRWRMP